MITSWEIYTPEQTLECSLEPYCEMIRIVFIYGPKPTEYEIEVPLEAFNKEVESAGYRINTYIPFSYDGVFEIRVELPKANIPWYEAIRQFQKYLAPPHKNNKRITNSPANPININTNIWLPMIFLTKRFHFKNLEEKIRQISLSETHCIPILSQLTELGSVGYSFRDIENKLCILLSNNIDSIPVQAFRGIEMANAILSIIQTSHGRTDGDPQSIVEWLYLVFPKVVAEKNKYGGTVMNIIKFLKIRNPYTAFIVWCYSTILPVNNGRKILGEHITELRLSNFKVLFSVQLNDIIWLLNNLKNYNLIGVNKSEINQLICQWISPQHSSHDCQCLFNYAIQNELLDFRSLNGGNLCQLLPYAFNFENVFNFIIKEIKLSPNLTKYREALNAKNKNLHLLSWPALKAAFHLLNPPYPKIPQSDSRNIMYSLYKAFDSIFFHWIYFHRQNVTLQIVDEYLHEHTTELSFSHSPHRKLLLYDVIMVMNCDDKTKELYQDVLFESRKYDYASALSRILDKKNVELANQTLHFIRSKIKSSTFMMSLFYKILAKFYTPLNDHSLISDVNEYSIEACLKICAKSHNHYIVKKLIPMIGFAFNTLSFQDILTIGSMISFPALFGDKSIIINSYDEDNILLCFFSNEIQQATRCVTHIHDSIQFVQWCHISSRALSIIFKFDFIKQDSYQFFIDDDPISKLPEIQNDEWQRLLYEQWQNIFPPRRGMKNLASLPPNAVYLYLIGFYEDEAYTDLSFIEKFKNHLVFIGFDNPVIIFLNSETEYQYNEAAVILYQNPNCEMRVSISSFIKSLFKYKDVPIVMNAVALQHILNEYPEEWNNYFKNDTDNIPIFEFPTDDEFTRIEWSEPTPTMLPTKKDLINFNTVDGQDCCFRSIGFKSPSIHLWRASIEWGKHSRIFACSIPNVPISIFNFALGPNLSDIQISSDDDEIQPEPEYLNFLSNVVFKQTSLCILSLICESIAGIEPSFD